MLTPEQKDHAIQLLQTGDELEAVRYLQKTLNISAEQALSLTEKLEQEAKQNQSDIEKELLSKLNDFKQRAMNRKGPNVGRLVGSIFMVIGAIMLTVVVYIFYSNYQFSKIAIPVTGELLKYDSYYSTDDDGGSTLMYTPTFKYSFNAKEYTHVSGTSSSGMDFQVGEKVEILVDPDNPESAQVNEFWERWLVAVILGFMGAMFSGLGYMAYALLGRVN